MLQLVSKEPLDAAGERESHLRWKRFQLAKLLRCTEEILVCAQKGEWETVEALENFRKEEIATCFSDHNDMKETPLIAEALATLIHLNKQIAELVKQAKDEVISTQRTLLNGKSAVDNYTDYREGFELS